jgi:hypothetical protein
LSHQRHTPAENEILPVGATFNGSHWPDHVRVVQDEPCRTSRVLVKVLTLDEWSCLTSPLFRHKDLATLEIETEIEGPTLQGDPLGFRLDAEATRIRLAMALGAGVSALVGRRGLLKQSAVKQTSRVSRLVFGADRKEACL